MSCPALPELLQDEYYVLGGCLRLELYHMPGKAAPELIAYTQVGVCVHVCVHACVRACVHPRGGRMHGGGRHGHGHGHGCHLVLA